MDGTLDHLYRLLVQRLAASFRDRDLAEEAVHEAFARALLRGLVNDGASQRLEAWLFTVARNVARDALRRRRRDGRAGTAAGRAVAAAHPLPTDVTAAVEARLDAQAVSAALGLLGPAQRQVLRLHYYEALSLREIAALTGRPLGTVKSRLHRALRQLRRALAATRGSP